MPINPEFALNLIKQRCAGDLDEDTFGAVWRGLSAAADQGDGNDEDEDEGLNDEICQLIIQTLDALAAKQGRLEAALKTLGADPASFADQADPNLTLGGDPNLDQPIGGIVPPVRPEPGPMIGGGDHWAR